ncbi:glycoside hydrolase family 15 protein [Psychroflexus sp. YR1-1]|uniref:Glycoside hydrolase family 15 protein n=1 Tax=Psychroflexus aurantiacus TaxID=2709310 RepID=A0A6B3QZW8_9FLAO|nr:glycoside hydrolase family 15 protein [Psychroflexus aurantiacus]NEV92610.1 glycoside hydrolase family 15 protein [Psychroflexus aurantiacus]
MNNLNYGIIGNCRTAALISDSGSLDWCCLPEFDSASVFAKLLDDKKGGQFAFKVDGAYTITQTYVENTCILKTEFRSENASFEVHDFLPRYRKEDKSYHAPPEVIRYLKVTKGTPKLRIDYTPKLEYALGNTEIYIKDDFIVALTEADKFDTLFLYTSLSKEAVVNSEEIELTEDTFFLMSYNEKIDLPSMDSVNLDYKKTLAYWLNWTENTPKFRSYNAMILRSAMTLKLLSYEKTGAILAAATTSLPETIGEVRNWDYRFCWIRDASMVVRVVSQLGHKRMTKRYLQFIIDLIPDKNEKLQIMYGINKEKELTEKHLSHLSGYMDSKPVRIGNAAYAQKQNDIYGILVDVIYQELVKFKSDTDNKEELWTITKGIAWVVGKHWQEADKGIWEFRTEDRHFTFSKVLCWVAIDRAIKISELFEKTSKLERWKILRQAIKTDILENAWNEDVQAFTQSYGSKDLDASVLLMESYDFIEAKDPKFVSTVKAIGRDLTNDGLLYRYKNEDDFGLPSSSFTICTFWYINSLIKIGEVKDAKQQFERLIGYSNHLGLLSEDIDFETKRLLGNFPQAYSHLALIETAINLSKAEE